MSVGVHPLPPGGVQTLPPSGLSASPGAGRRRSCRQWIYTLGLDVHRPEEDKYSLNHYWDYGGAKWGGRRGGEGGGSGM